MPLLRIRVSPTLKLAAQSAAGRSGLSLSEWARQALDSASGQAKLTRQFRGAGSPGMAPGEVFRGGLITVRVDGLRLERYQSSATLAWLELSPWCAVIIAVAARISKLPEQINRIA